MSYIYETVTVDTMIRRARELGRYHQLGGEDGVRALFEHYSAIAADTGKPIQLNIIEMADNWTFYANARHAVEKLGAPVDAWQTVAKSLAWLRQDHKVLKLPSCGVLVNVA